ncbi:MAG: hypothetical protein QM599_02225 [Pseudoxanthomonas sp.]
MRAIASWQTGQLLVQAVQSVAEPGHLPPLEVFTLPRDGRFPDRGQAQLQADVVRRTA